ncbi:MAG: FRG domain-containing protein [Sedimentisphaerales bacterium]|nr:FRG domain-containing protein [Sedimentisphaerales bacterium]
MKQIDAKAWEGEVKTWEEFKELADRKVREAWERPRGQCQWYPSEILFRGQGDAGWPLVTTLQRQRPDIRSLSQYFELMREDREHTGTREWDLDEPLALNPLVRLKGTPFMVSLRQNGFPSPLLDWTSSAYIAAFFAFRIVHKGIDRPERVSIFTFQEFPDGNVHFHATAKQWLQRVGPNIVTDKKHRLQQAQYTLCLCQEQDDDNDWLFDSYDGIHTRKDYKGVFRKYDITFAQEEQQKVLCELSRRGITASSLFESD